MGADMVLYEAEFEQIVTELARLQAQTGAKLVFLVDRNGQLIASAGETGGVDTTALASLTAGNLAATSGIAKLLGEQEFSILFHEGDQDNIHISLVGHRVILVVIFDRRTSLGLVRLRVKQSVDVLGGIFARLFDKVEQGKQGGEAGISPLAEISDDDIDRLFG